MPDQNISLHPTEQADMHSQAASELRERSAQLPKLTAEGLLPEHATAIQSALTEAATLLASTAQTHETASQGATALGHTDHASGERYASVPEATRTV